MSLSVDYLKVIEPKSINPPSLKKLKLGFIEINDNFLTMLLSGCPLLEELVMEDCYLDVREIFYNKLKKLTLNGCNQSWRMQISCPGVVSLCCKYLYRQIILKNMLSLVNADLCLVNWGSSDDVNMDLVGSSSDLKILGGLSNITTLKLDFDCYDFLVFLVHESMSSKCPAFNNLTSLTLENLTLGDMDDSYMWLYLVDWFLQHSPNLKKLSLDFLEVFPGRLDQGFVRVLTMQRLYLEALVINDDDEISAKMIGELVSTLVHL